MHGTFAVLILGAVLAAGAAAPEALAAEPDLGLSNASIQAVKMRMAGRAAQVLKWKDRAAIAEGNDGRLAAVAAPGLTLAEKKEVRDLVAGENDDRAALFRELAIANAIGPEALNTVGAAYAVRQRAAAQPEHLVQPAAGGAFVARKDLKG